MNKSTLMSSIDEITKLTNKAFSNKELLKQLKQLTKLMDEVYAISEKDEVLIDGLIQRGIFIVEDSRGWSAVPTKIHNIRFASFVSRALRLPNTPFYIRRNSKSNSGLQWVRKIERVGNFDDPFTYDLLPMTGSEVFDALNDEQKEEVLHHLDLFR
jgi:hypothetical protein